MKLKNLPHIVAATALAVLLTVLGSACATAPKPPLERVYDSTVPENLTATLYIPPSYIEVFEFDRKPLNLNYSILARIGTNVIIPAGDHNIRFNFRGGAAGLSDAINLTLNFKAVAGRAYHLMPYVNTLTGGTLISRIYENSVMREPEPEEQLLFIKQEGLGDFIFVLDKGTDDERLIYMYKRFWSGYAYGETRIIVPKGEHTIDVQKNPLIVSQFNSGVYYEPKGGEQPRVFTASSEPVRYIIALDFGKKNEAITYVLTVQSATQE